MGVINKTTDEINTLLEKVENMPSEGGMGKTPVLQTGTTTTLEPGSNATSQVVSKGADSEGNPIYAINFGIPRGADGQDGSSTGGGGTADSVQWSNVLNKPSWVNSSVKPNYTALEVGAIASGGLKTINGQSLEGQGDITISGGSGSGGIPDAPRNGELYTRTNGNWTAPYEINGKTITSIPYSSMTQEVSNQPLDFSEFGALGDATALAHNYFYFVGTKVILAKVLSMDVPPVSEDLIYTLTLSVTQEDGTPSLVYLILNETKSTYSTKIHRIGESSGSEGSGGTSGDNSYALNISIFSLKTGSTSEEISAAVGGISGYQKILQAVNDGKSLCLKAGSTAVQLLATNLDNSMLFLQGIGMGPFGSNFAGILVIEYEEGSQTFSATSADIPITEIPAS